MKSGSEQSPFRQQRGFTLIEVVVAVAVLAFAMFSVSQVVSSQIAGTSYMKEKTIAHWVGHNILTEMQSGGAFPNTGRKTGDAEMAGVIWEWTYDVKKTDDPNIRRVEIEVRLEDQEQLLASLTGFLGKPLGVN